MADYYSEYAKLFSRDYTDIDGTSTALVRINYALSPSGEFTTINITGVNGSNLYSARERTLPLNTVLSGVDNAIAIQQRQLEFYKKQLEDVKIYSPELIPFWNKKIASSLFDIAYLMDARKYLVSNYDIEVAKLHHNSVVANVAPPISETPVIVQSEPVEEAVIGGVDNSPILVTSIDAPIPLNEAPLAIETPSNEEILTPEEIAALNAATTGNQNELPEVSVTASRIYDDEKNSGYWIDLAQFNPKNPPTVTDSTVNTDIPKSQTNIGVTPNPLHKYVNYTYGISLHLLTKNEYNNMVKYPDGDNPSGSWGPKRTLIASAGKYDTSSNGFMRDDNFREDFFFDDLRMVTIVGLNHASPGTNVIEISFTIIEPYGFTLLDRLIHAVTDSANPTNGETDGVDGKNYLEVPYLLQIDFYGYNDIGVSANLREHRKFIPIKLTEMKMKVGVKGAEYNVKAVPYNHIGFMESSAATPANFEVTASTLTEFFKSDVNVDDMLREKERIENSGDSRETNAKAVYAARSYTSAYNAWMNGLTQNKYQTDNTTISVVFDSKILSSNNGQGGNIINDSQSTKQAAEVDSTNKNEKINAIMGSAQKATANPNMGASKFNINGGTSVIAVINQIMLASNYVQSQIIDVTKNIEENVEKANRPLDWWKVVPSVQMKKFCTQTGKWTYHITYNVISYTVYNQSHPRAPKAIPNAWFKEYNYIYTGKNDDIIDFQIDFDALFYTAITVQTGKVTKTNQTLGKDQSDNRSLDDRKRNDVFGDPLTNGKGVNPVKIENKNDNIQATNSASTRRDSQSMGAADVAQSVAATSVADMLSVKLKIVGDPMFIKQDDIMDNPIATKYDNLQNGKYTTGYVRPDNATIAMDAGEVHAMIQWKTPIDIDERTGFMDWGNNSKLVTSSISGLYKLLSVESVFSGGKFEQTLEMIRLPNQPNDVVPSNVERKVDKSDKNYYFAADQIVETTVPTSITTTSMGIRTSTQPDYISGANIGNDDTIITNNDLINFLNSDISGTEDISSVIDQYFSNEAALPSNLTTPQMINSIIDLGDEFFGKTKTSVSASLNLIDDVAIMNKALGNNQNFYATAPLGSDVNSLINGTETNEVATILQRFNTGLLNNLKVSATVRVAELNEYSTALKAYLNSSEFNSATPEQKAQLNNSINYIDSNIPTVVQSLRDISTLIERVAGINNGN